MRIFAAIALIASTVLAQTYPLPLVASRDVAWPNTTGQGTSTLFTRVFYPSTVQGHNAPVLPKKGGWPVLLFLHGFSYMGRDYPALCAEWARQGFVVVAPDTGIWSYITLAQDAHANLGAIAAENVAVGGPFRGAFDLSRIGVAGHSMGGGTMAFVIAQNPQIRCAFGFAPAAPTGSAAAAITVPFGCVVGDGDVLTPYSQHAQPYLAGVDASSPLKFMARLGAASDHFSIAGMSGATPDFARAVDMSVGFFRHFLDVDADALEQCLGPAVIADPQVVAIEQDIAHPRIWSAGALVPGATVRVSVAAESGDGVIFAGPSVPVGVPTAIGTLLLDPSQAFTWISSIVPDVDRLDAQLYVPNTTAVIGVEFALQPAAPTSSASMRFGSLKEFVVGR